MSLKHFSVITLFPGWVESLKTLGVVGRAFEKNILSLECINPREFSEDVHQTIDDKPYGGGPGMVMMAEPLYQSIQKAKITQPNASVIYLSPKGEKLTQNIVSELAQLDSMILISGRYEGIDQRLIDEGVDREISVGDYVLSGGELPAMMLVDAIARLVPGVLGDEQSAEQDSFAGNEGLLDHPHYTRPAIWRDQPAPEVLLSGNHQKINQWRSERALEMTKQRRPDLFALKDEKNKESGI